LTAEAEVPKADNLLAPIHLRTPLGEMKLCTTATTIETAYDVTLEELRLETLLPADTPSEHLLKRIYY
jgi:hypothetical protein